jgi:hypothetical protein
MIEIYRLVYTAITSMNMSGLCLVMDQMKVQSSEAAPPQPCEVAPPRPAANSDPTTRTRRCTLVFFLRPSPCHLYLPNFSHRTRVPV